MATHVVMPQLGESVSEGTIVEWFVKPGDTVAVGDLLVEVETDKANAEVQATEAGTVSRILAEPGAVVEVGEPPDARGNKMVDSGKYDNDQYMTIDEDVELAKSYIPYHH